MLDMVSYMLDLLNQLLDLLLETRGKKTGKKLYDKIKDLDTKMYYTDYWEPYEKFLPNR